MVVFGVDRSQICLVKVTGNNKQSIGMYLHVDGDASSERIVCFPVVGCKHSAGRMAWSTWSVETQCPECSCVKLLPRLSTMSYLYGSRHHLPFFPQWFCLIGAVNHSGWTEWSGMLAVSHFSMKQNTQQFCNSLWNLSLSLRSSSLLSKDWTLARNMEGVGGRRLWCFGSAAPTLRLLGAPSWVVLAMLVVGEQWSSLWV